MDGYHVFFLFFFIYGRCFSRYHTTQHDIRRLYSFLFVFIFFLWFVQAIMFFSEAYFLSFNRLHHIWV